MSSDERRLPFLDGTLAVQDHGGTGSPVLLLHHPGGNSAGWHSLLPFLVDRHRVVALDLPGHGQSTATPRDAFDVADAIALTCTELGLDRPVIVADDCTGYHAAVAAIRHDLSGPLVLISGFFLSSRESVLAVLDLFVDEPTVAFITAEQFALGEPGHTEKEKDQLTERLISRSGEGWLDEGATAGARVAYRRSLVDLPDGTWVRQPVASSMCGYFGVDRSDEWFPSPALLERTGVPILMVVSSDGADGGVLDATGEYRGELPSNVELCIEEAGLAPRHSIPHTLAEVVERATHPTLPRPVPLGDGAAG